MIKKAPQKTKTGEEASCHKTLIEDSPNKSAKKEIKLK